LSQGLIEESTLVYHRPKTNDKRSFRFQELYDLRTKPLLEFEHEFDQRRRVLLVADPRSRP